MIVHMITIAHKKAFVNSFQKFYCDKIAFFSESAIIIDIVIENKAKSR